MNTAAAGETIEAIIHTAKEEAAQMVAVAERTAVQIKEESGQQGKIDVWRLLKTKKQKLLSALNLRRQLLMA